MTDLDAAQAFYEGLLGLEVIVRVEGRHAFFRAGPDSESVVLCFIAEATRVPPPPGARLPVPPHGAEGQGHVALAVASEHLAGWADYLKENNVEIEADFLWPTGRRSIYLRDPAGNSVELADRGLWRGEA
ncbi:Catechol 2,3-dioxygenase [Celeribacter indicus]|nr:Catechol 2,3-dioxygenase [Celeribacter indicus]